jgi:hypothetical protein
VIFTVELGVADPAGELGIIGPIDPLTPAEAEDGDAPAARSPLVHATAIRANETAATDARLGAWIAGRIAGERNRRRSHLPNETAARA